VAGGPNAIEKVPDPFPRQPHRREAGPGEHPARPPAKTPQKRFLTHFPLFNWIAVSFLLAGKRSYA
jgi:hypothetical protein